MNKNKKTFQQIFANQKIVEMILKLDKFFIKLPHLPKKFNFFITKIIPWIVLLGGIISSIAVAISFLLAILSLIALDLNLMISMTGSLLLILLNALFLIKAFKPLRKNDAVGWIYLFWANILGVVNSVINIINGDGQILLTIALTLLGFYLLFEITPFYAYRKERKFSKPDNL